MKKIYSKPEIMYEDFTPSTSIAVNCEQLANMSPGSCAAEFPFLGYSIFLEGVTGCTKVVTDGSQEYGGICYDNPTPGYKLFTS